MNKVISSNQNSFRRTLGSAFFVLLFVSSGCKKDSPTNAEVPYTGPPIIEFTRIPSYRSFDNLVGRARGMDPQSCYVAVYIFVEGLGWWTKPYFAVPRTPIRSDATWTCDVTTGGIDEYATRYAAFVLADTVSPPILGGNTSLPALLDSIAIASVSTVRSPGL
jgi:hypothetical protein